jgi:hypothetical protein
VIGVIRQSKIRHRRHFPNFVYSTSFFINYAFAGKVKALIFEEVKLFLVQRGIQYKRVKNKSGVNDKSSGEATKKENLPTIGQELLTD